jgi:hypothetical protein
LEEDKGDAMLRYLIVGLGGGVLFGIMDGLINGNSLAQKLYATFDPVLKKAVNIPAGIVIDLIYGFVLAGIFLLLYQSLPGDSGWLKGITFGFMIFFFRIVMQVASQWMMFKVSSQLLIYILASGLIEMLLLGLYFGLLLKPAK